MVTNINRLQTGNKKKYYIYWSFNQGQQKVLVKYNSYRNTFGQNLLANLFQSNTFWFLKISGSIDNQFYDPQKWHDKMADLYAENKTTLCNKTRHKYFGLLVMCWQSAVFSVFYFSVVISGWTLVTCVDLWWTIVTCVDLWWTIVTCVDLWWTIVTCVDPWWTIVTCVDPWCTIVTCVDPWCTIVTCVDP